MKKIVLAGTASDFGQYIKNKIDAAGAAKETLEIYTADALGEIDSVTRDSYDGVFGILGNDPDENDRMIARWVGNPHFRVSDNANRLIEEIMFFLGIPEPLEIERKYLIEYPNIRYLNSLPNCSRVEIMQTYMKDENGENMRLRKRGDVYFFTQKKNITPVKRVEIERRLTEAEYRDLYAAGKKKRSLTKDRYCLMYDGQYFEIDIYPFWNEQAVMEIELSYEDQEIRFPEFIRVIKEVSGDKKYNNSTLANAE